MAFLKKIKKITKRFFLKYKYFIILILLLTSSLFYILFFSNIFKIKNIEIDENILNSNAEEYIKKNIQGNIFLFSVKNFKNSFQFRFPEFSKIEIKKRYFDGTILLQLIKEKEIGIWCEKDIRCFYFNSEGYIFKEAPKNVSGSALIIIRDYPSKVVETLVLPYKVLDKKLLDFISIIFGILKEFNMIAVFSINRDNFEIIAETKNYPKIIFNLIKISEYEKNTIRKILQSLRDKFPELEYIDLRILDRVYYKMHSLKTPLTN